MIKPYRLSVVIPMYRVERHITRVLTTLKGEAHPDFEVLLIDDCSPDRTVEVCEKLVGDDRRFTLLQNRSNRGSGATRNTGIRHATGDYLIFIDSDDDITPGSLSRINSELRLHPTVDILCMAGTVFEEISGELVRVGTIINFEEGQSPRPGRALLSDVGRFGGRLGGYSVLNIVRRDFLLKHQLFQDEDFALLEDSAWTPKLYYFSESVAAIKYEYYHYIRRHGSLTTGLNEKSLQDTHRCFEVLSNFYHEKFGEMDPGLRKFWANHTLNVLLWHSFHSQYRWAFSRSSRWSRLSGLLSSERNRSFLRLFFREVSTAKKVGIILLFFGTITGSYLLADAYFGLLFFVRAKTKSAFLK